MLYLQAKFKKPKKQIVKDKKAPSKDSESSRKKESVRVPQKKSAEKEKVETKVKNDCETRKKKETDVEKPIASSSDTIAEVENTKEKLVFNGELKLRLQEQLIAQL